jgi:hypothetical protein
LENDIYYPLAAFTLAYDQEKGLESEKTFNLSQNNEFYSNL